MKLVNENEVKAAMTAEEIVNQVKAAMTAEEIVNQVISLMKPFYMVADNESGIKDILGDEYLTEVSQEFIVDCTGLDKYPFEYKVTIYGHYTDSGSDDYVYSVEVEERL